MFRLHRLRSFSVVLTLVMSFAVACGESGGAGMADDILPVVGDPETSQPGTFGASVFQIWKTLNSAHSVLRAREKDIVDNAREWSKLLTATLDSVSWEPVFTGTTDAARLNEIVVAIGELEAHGLKPESYPVTDLRAAVDEYSAGPGIEGAALAELEAIPGWVEISPFVDRSEKPTAGELNSLPAAVLRLDAENMERMAAAAAKLADARKELAARRAKVEVLATWSYLRYAMDMRFRIVASPFRAQRNPLTAHDAFSKELIESFASFVADPAGTMAKLPPAHPSYRRAMQALAAYRAMAGKGPFPDVKIPVKYRVGMKTDNIVRIKERLAREGYYDAAMDPVYDAYLVEAVKKYQTNHGYEADGILDPRHEKSLNVPLQTRISQLELSLQRWRESDVRDGGPLYVRVNIPEFMMEVWKGAERVFHNRVVVGNNNWDVDPAAKTEGRINRTKIFSATIENIVVNPRWNVPMRVRQVELDYDLLSQPDFLLKNNYVVEMLPDGREIVYQKSGAGNALGKIKFNFPNKYGIFMHDTNMKPYFKKEIRAFSHGCVRLDDPVPVAKFIMAEASKVSPDSIDADLRISEPDPRSIKLDVPVPITIEYNSVGIDDDGMAMFFSDVYSYDRDYFAGKIPYSADELALLKRKITQAD